MASKRTALTTPPLTAIPPKSGNYFYPASGPALGTSATLGIGTIRVIPWFCETAVSLARMAVDISGAGEAGAKVRLGIYADTGAYYPGVLQLDAGQVAADAIAMVEATISITLPRGVYWLASAVQNVTTTQPGLRTVSTWVPPVPFPVGTSMPTANSVPATSYSSTGVTAAFPSTFPAGAAIGATVPRVILRAA